MNVTTSAVLLLSFLVAASSPGVSQIEIASLADEAAYDDIQWNEYEAFRDVHADTDVAWELLLAALEPGADAEPLERPESGWLLVGDTWVMAEEIPYRTSLWSRVRVRVGGMTTTDHWSRAEALLNSVAALLEERIAYAAWLEAESHGGGAVELDDSDSYLWAAAPIAYILGGGPYYGFGYGYPYWWLGCNDGCDKDCDGGWNDHWDHGGGGVDDKPKPDGGGSTPDLTPRRRVVHMTDLARRVASLRSRPGGSTVQPGPDAPVRRTGPSGRSGGSATPAGIIVRRPASQPQTLSHLASTRSPIRTRVVRTSSRSRLTLPTQRRTSSRSQGRSLTSRLGSRTASRSLSGPTRRSTSSRAIRAGSSRSGVSRASRSTSRGTGRSGGSGRSGGRSSGRSGGRR
jgi:hypothetical protein